jgi:selenide,water dikinase
VLRQLPPMADERLLTAPGHVEDAAAYLLDAERAIVFTTDYFTPVVDDPYAFGQIAAANAFSDVYAMGGRPTLALNIVLFPTRTHRLDEMMLILRGGADKAVEAGCLIVGGHTVDDPEPKYGLAVVGEAHPARLLRKDAARPGDRIVLTKPLGTGILATAFKGDDLTEAEYGSAVDSMRRLNRAASEAAVEAGLAAATDVTGFGLLGHLMEMCQEGSLSATVRFGALPFFDLVERHAAEDNVPGGTRSNLEAVRDRLAADPSIPPHRLLMAADAQTSGGLLLAVPPSREAALREALSRRRQEAWTVGEFAEGPPSLRLDP